MNRVKEHKALAELIRPYGLEMVRERKHYSIRKGAVYVATVSHSPSDQNFARQTVRDLVRKGHLPESVKGIKI
jgi:hypothetical protein